MEPSHIIFGAHMDDKERYELFFKTLDDLHDLGETIATKFIELTKCSYRYEGTTFDHLNELMFVKLRQNNSTWNIYTLTFGATSLANWEQKVADKADDYLKGLEIKRAHAEEKALKAQREQYEKLKLIFEKEGEK